MLWIIYVFMFHLSRNITFHQGWFDDILSWQFDWLVISVHIYIFLLCAQILALFALLCWFCDVLDCFHFFLLFFYSSFSLSNFMHVLTVSLSFAWNHYPVSDLILIFGAVQVIGGSAAKRYGGKRVLTVAVLLWSFSTMSTVYLHHPYCTFLPSLTIVSFHQGLVYLHHEHSLSPPPILHRTPFPHHQSSYHP